MMAYLSRKQRDLQRRVELILQVGHDLLLKFGYRGLTMNRIAELTEYSKGTIYQHFSCKEEIILQLASQSTKRLQEVLGKVSAYDSPTHVRVALLAEACYVFFKKYPLEFGLLSTIKSRAIRERVSDVQLKELELLERAIITQIEGILTKGVNAGELILAEGFSEEELAHGTWFMLYGSAAFFDGIPANTPDAYDKLTLIRKNFHAYIAAWRWQGDRISSGELIEAVNLASIQLFNGEGGFSYADNH